MLRILPGALIAASFAAGAPMATFEKYCYSCHAKSAAMGGISLDKLSAGAPATMGERFQQWDKVASVLEARRMPPPKMPQPEEAARVEAARWIRARLGEYAAKHAGDPGRVTVRRLTSGEYLYALRDLTGVDLKLDGDTASDSVGGEGFANFGDVQFMQDAGLERYLESAKRVADHAVIGAGPLSFFDDPGKSGFELSAISRIQAIYTKYGFRATSGEGGKPYGLDRFARAFYVAWRYKHRAALGEPKSTTIAALAAREGLTARFAEHIWAVVDQPAPTYPTTEVIAQWRALPAPGGDEKAVREGCTAIQKFLVDWPRFLLGAGGVAEGGQGDERALVLTEEEVQAVEKHRYRFLSFLRRGENGKMGPPVKLKRVYVSAVTANPAAKEKPVILFRNAAVRFRKADRSAMALEPLTARLDDESLKRLSLERAGADKKTDEFAVPAGQTIYFDLMVPEGAALVELQAEAEIGAAVAGADDAVVRCTINDKPNNEGRPVSALLGHPASPGYALWKKNVLQFAAQLPQVSHGEPTPSDKDPIPAPYNNTYNQPERDSYHTRVKYYRTDGFLVEKMLDDQTRLELERAWSDLKASFEYHDAFLNFVAAKYKVDLHKKGIGELTEAEIEAIPAEPRKFVKELRVDYDAVMKAQMAGQPGHVNDALEFAARAWRRPLTAAENDRLRSFYVKTREASGLSHVKAMRLLLARILVSPAFLYRLEAGQPQQQQSKLETVRPLAAWDLASRLSFFLWASVPDAELRRAAAAGELATAAGLERQVKRMLADPKARRFATEFFGQWLGFYRFDQYRGVDAARFPEFTDEVKSAMYDEAVSFFEHVVREDRPVRELIAADYTFLNAPLARHYGIKKEIKAAPGKMVLVKGANEFQRGGMLRLGAVLTATSAPLRTSPVKRGDWMLRRVLGTPTPPPPADAGSIPADDKQFAGQTVRERLAAHMRNPTCAACHSRIDPLGFPFERYDPVGRWRETYSDGKPVHDAGTLAAGDQRTISGVDGLIGYLQSQETQVMRTMSQKLAGYALGRTMLASDQPLLDKMSKAGGAASFSKLITEVVLSKQFRNQKIGGVVAANAARKPKSGAAGTEGGL